MRKSIVSRGGAVVRASCGSPMIESMEPRQLLSAVPLVHLSRVRPGRILAGTTGTEVVRIHNPGTTSETVNVDITLAPSLDGTTPAGSYSSPGINETLTIKAHRNAKVQVPFVPPTTLAAGKYHTLATVQLGTQTIIGTAPGTYTLKLPPGVTTTPSLVGDFSGLIVETSSSSGGIFGGGSSTHTKEATFVWQTTSQTTTSLTGTFSIGSGQVTGTMTGSEFTNGKIQYTLTSDNINFVIKGKVTPDGTKITGNIVATLVNNIFKKLAGHFKITRQL